MDFFLFFFFTILDSFILLFYQEIKKVEVRRLMRKIRDNVRMYDLGSLSLCGLMEVMSTLSVLNDFLSLT